MPVTDPLQRADSGITEYGRVFSGGVAGANRPGVKQQHFRFEPNPNHPLYTPAQLMSAWVATYGDKPHTITNVRFFSDRFDDVLDNWYEKYGASAKQSLMLRKCTGEYCVKQRTASGMNYIPVPCLCIEEGTFGTKDGCDQRGRLKMQLFDFMANLLQMTQIPSNGAVVFVTQSNMGLRNIRGGLTRTLNDFGRLMGIPHILGKKLEPVQAPNGMKNLEWIPYLDFGGTTIATMLESGISDEGQRAIALPSGTPNRAPALSSGVGVEVANDDVLVWHTAIQPQVLGGKSKGQDRWQVIVDGATIAPFTYTREPFRQAGIDVTGWTQGVNRLPCATMHVQVDGRGEIKRVSIE